MAIHMSVFLLLKPKCDIYFPNLEDVNQNNEKLTFGRFELNFVSETLFKGYVIREIEIENLDVSP